MILTICLTESLRHWKIKTRSCKQHLVNEMYLFIWIVVCIRNFLAI